MASNVDTEGIEEDSKRNRINPKPFKIGECNSYSLDSTKNSKAFANIDIDNDS